MTKETTSDIVGSIKEVYGDDNVDGCLLVLQKEKPALKLTRILKSLEEEPTTKLSYFCRDDNLLMLAENFLYPEKERIWKILSVGCGDGSEPYELALRMLAGGQSNFQIDSVDVSKKVIAEAQKGEYLLANTMVFDDGFRFLELMVKSGFVQADSSSTETNISSTKVKVFRLNQSVKDKVRFFVHDMIEVSPKTGNSYDIILCSWLLMHYPTWTREVILAHALEKLNDKGLFVFEEESLDGFRDPERAEWLSPYYKWRRDLARFGLKRNPYLPTFYDYSSSRNLFRGKHLAIRNRMVVDIS